MPDYHAIACKRRGFSLVELMIAVAIIGLLAVVAAPYTASWIHSANVQEAESILKLAHGKARALALRNPLNRTEAADGSRQIAAGVRYDAGTLLVCQGDPADGSCTAGGANLVWSRDLPGGVAVTLDDGAMGSYGLDNTGQAIDGGGSPVTLAYGVAKGGEERSDVLR